MFDSMILSGDWLLINFAAMSHFIAFFMTYQLILRLFLFFGNVLYACYYYIVADEPLWMAMTWSILFCVANFSVILRIISRKKMIERDLGIY